jgi:DNA invertase Pin-like site-specific DNA recombinase
MSKNGAVGYARVSSEEQARENNSLPMQKRKISSYCDQNGFSLLQTFEDSKSGRDMYRPGLHKLLEFCEGNRERVSCVIVSDLSRLNRNLFDQATIITRLNALGIELVSIDEPLTNDSALGKFLRNQLGSVNQLLSDSRSEGTRERMRAVVRTGRFLWGAPIGYMNINKSLTVDPARGSLVAEAFNLVASGRFVTTDAVLRFITAMGLRTKKAKS